MKINDILDKIEKNYAHPSNDIGHLVGAMRDGKYHVRKQLADLVCSRPAMVHPKVIHEISRWGINDDLSECSEIRALKKT